MTHQSCMPLTPRMEAAIAELQGLIARRYPSTTFDVSEGDDPEGIYLSATVDVADMGEVVDLFLDRLVDLQVEEGLPLFVVPVRPAARVVANLRGRPIPVLPAPLPLR